jgi:cytochrome P450
MLSLASFLSIAATTLGIVYDLLNRPKSFKQIRGEMTRIHKEIDDKVTRQALGQLIILDNFIKESQRTNPINQSTLTPNILSLANERRMLDANAGIVSTHRLALQDFTFKDELHLMTKTDIAFSNELINENPNIWGLDVAAFDPHRFLRMREAGDLARSQMTSVTNDIMSFGNDPYVCPDRFLATDDMKIMLMNLMYRYEFKYPEGVTSRPKNNKKHHSMLPCSTMPLLFKEKKAYDFS